MLVFDDGNKSSIPFRFEDKEHQNAGRKSFVLLYFLFESSCQIVRGFYKSIFCFWLGKAR